jgi:hypothetical protein
LCVCHPRRFWIIWWTFIVLGIRDLLPSNRRLGDSWGRYGCKEQQVYTVLLGTKPGHQPKANYFTDRAVHARRFEGIIFRNVGSNLVVICVWFTLPKVRLWTFLFYIFSNSLI